MNIGFIGLGKMGSPMIRNLLKAGYKVNIYDKNPSTFKTTIDLGPINKILLMISKTFH